MKKLKLLIAMSFLGLGIAIAQPPPPHPGGSGNQGAALPMIGILMSTLIAYSVVKKK